ncbi:hypothetical protein SCUCBS95973_006668 [Sporothrix curviconia]|uniref:RTA1 domain protein n=1 Tax=Sporothrix curviconia TaxID=1260050 RepID=A0ABP0C7E1_9PEZI
MTYYKFYHYDPSLAASCIFAIVFGLSTAWHIFTMVRARTWFLLPVVIAGIFEIAGYAARAVSHSEAPNLSLGPYVVQTLLLLVAPPLLAATMYMLLGRVIAAVDGEAYSLVPTKWLTKIFVASDVVCFIVQLGGAGLMASAQAATSATGAHIVLAGLIIQIVVFGLFVVVAGMFHRRLQASQRQARQPQQATLLPQTFLLVLYVTSGLVLVRNIVRVAEFIEGFDGYIILHEAFLYVFDALPMAAVMAIFNGWHPSRLVKNVAGGRRKASGDSSLEMGSMGSQT